MCGKEGWGSRAAIWGKSILSRTCSLCKGPEESLVQVLRLVQEAASGSKVLGGARGQALWASETSVGTSLVCE